MVTRGEVPTLDTVKRALLLENIHPDATTRLAKAGYEVSTESRALSEDELVSAAAGVSLLGIRSSTHVTERVLNHLSGAQGGLVAVYQRFEYLEDRKRALLTWGLHVERLVTDQAKPTNVIPFNQSA